MRISDDRYSRDRLRLDLALRFIQHEARTQTIRAWTGLTDDRIRKLYRSYFARSGAAAIARPRGRSPGQASFFTRSPRLQQEAALLASLCSLLGVLPQRTQPRAGAQHPGIAQGVALCQAYETYRALVPTARITFEHLVYLNAALLRGDELKVANCGGCGALLVVERMALREARCLACATAVAAEHTA
ncbi:MAG TPA: hypothetical protein VMU67_15910 [Steroidobacteraceae bacterium]|nr:hypothetical protein [Steroidobacteraceae bacterium]